MSNFQPIFGSQLSVLDILKYTLHSSLEGNIFRPDRIVASNSDHLIEKLDIECSIVQFASQFTHRDFSRVFWVLTTLTL